MLNYLLLICEGAEIILGTTMLKEIDRNAAKYPIEESLGRAIEYTELSESPARCSVSVTSSCRNRPVVQRLPQDG